MGLAGFWQDECALEEVCESELEGKFLCCVSGGA